MVRSFDAAFDKNNFGKSGGGGDGEEEEDIYSELGRSEVIANVSQDEERQEEGRLPDLHNPLFFFKHHKGDNIVDY